MLNKTLKVNGVRIKWARNILLVGILLAVIIGIAVVYSQRGTSPYSKVVSIGTREIHLRVADTEPERIQGLSGWDSLGKNDAMLFVFPKQEEQCMWMKDMKFSLDMVWLDSNKKITKIVEHIAPETYPQSFCGEAKYVIEFNAGTIQGSNIKIGQNFNF